MPRSDMQLGVRENFGQFALLVVVNAFVGAMVGMERSILPAIAEADFHLAARAPLPRRTHRCERLTAAVSLTSIR